MRRPISLLLALLLLASSLAAAAGVYVASTTDERVQVTTASLRTGDVLRYDVLHEPRGGDMAGTGEDAILLLRVEGANRTHDRYGILRDTEDFLVQQVYRSHATGEERPGRAFRCHALRGSPDVVAIDSLTREEGMGMSVSVEWTLNNLVTLHKDEVRRNVTLQREYYNDECPGRETFPARTFTEGQVATLGDFHPHVPGGLHRDVFWWNHTSEPAKATTFNGRKALSFVFPATVATQARGEAMKVTVLGTMTLTIAEGLPGIVRSETIPFPEYSTAERDQGNTTASMTMGASVRELTGFIPGNGSELHPLDGTRLPRTHPEAAFEPFDRVAFDDAPLGLAFPLSEALTWIRLDPHARFEQWMDEHPDAFLTLAYYDRRARGESEQEETLGAWSLVWEDGKDMLQVRAVKTAGARTPLGPVAGPVQPVRVLSNDWRGASHFGDHEGVTLPRERVSLSGVAELLATRGLPGARIESLTYFHSTAEGDPLVWLAVSDVSMSGPRDNSTATGVEHLVDLVAGGLVHEASVFAAYERSGLLHPFPAGADGAWQERFAVHSVDDFMPPLGTGVVAGAAAIGAAAALYLLTKLLFVPFYTRLKRDRLLDNPVRARLYEAVRTSPGITQQELMDFAGIGDGATRHHLDQLVAHRLLFEVREDRHVRFFAAGEVPPELARREAVLRAGSNRRVYELLRAEPHLSLREAGARLGMSAPSVHKCVRKLREAGLLPAEPPAPRP